MPTTFECLTGPVAGIDTHTDTHTVAIISDTGRHIATDTFPATNLGYKAISEFIATSGVTTVGVEGTSSYGAGLTRYLRTQKYTIVEVLRPTRTVRRRDGKSDPVDAVAAARQVLTGEALSIPKDTSGPVESLRGLQITRRQIVMTAAKLMTTIKSLLVTAPDEIRCRYSAMSTLVMVESLSRCRPSADLADPRNGVLFALKTLASTYRDLQEQATQIEEHISILVEIINPHVTSIFGCGSVVAADLIVSVGDNPSRIHSEAALAHLCGVAPIPASSGRTHRHRLNRGGDRRANAALHRIALVRMHHEQRTRDYVTKRTKEGLSKKEILRCLKRAIAREVYRVLCQNQTATSSGQIGVAELKARRVERQLSQAQIAEKLGCKPARISDIETGKRPLPQLRTAYEQLLNPA
ncbi:Mobile element protein [Corynebacterium casei]|uniref:IS110 family transposase n=1 Tax=Corynebacterium casei TaxID=160386 RepID=UPI0009D46CE7|nr:IS110 family transposase [Corynebacterium casei]SLM93541.1 Mobile element protein [Corynebacterium casei]